jgi:hypothetical protein
MSYRWTGGPMIFMYSDPNGMTLAEVAEDNMKSIGWNAFDLTQRAVVKIGDFVKLEEAKAAVERYFRPGNGKAVAAA